MTLGDALRLCLLLRDSADERYERAAVRWLGRFALEARAATLAELREAAVALDELPERPNYAMEVLSKLCVRHGLGERGAPSEVTGPTVTWAPSGNAHSARSPG